MDESPIQKWVYRQGTLILAIFATAWGIFSVFTERTSANDNRVTKLESDVSYISQAVKEIPELRKDLRLTRESMLELQGEIKKLIIQKQ